jgi:holliday junction DNA helicase RuvB
MSIAQTGPNEAALVQELLNDPKRLGRECWRCKAAWNLADRPTLACPKCGATWTEAECASILKKRLENIAEKEAAAINAEVAATKDAKKSRSAPPWLDDVVGNPRAVLQIRTALDGFEADVTEPGAPKWLPFPHTLLSGPGGTGKTMLAEIIARELGRKIHLQLGQTLSTPAKIAEVLLALRPGEVMFIDEIHGLPPRCQESLYRAMEDGVLVPVTRTGQPVSKPVQLAPFTLIGATTDEWGLLPSMCQRFKYRIRLVRMTPEEIAHALTQRAKRSGLSVTPEAITLMAGRSLGTPRLAIGLLDGCLVTAKAQRVKDITADIVQMMCAIWGLDSLGLDRTARQYLGFLADAGGGPVRLNILASKLGGLAKMTVERKVEPDLVWLNLIEKSANGRTLTERGREHLRERD